MDYAWQGWWTYTGWYEPFGLGRVVLGMGHRMAYRWIIRLEVIG